MTLTCNFCMVLRAEEIVLMLVFRLAAGTDIYVDAVACFVYKCDVNVLGVIGGVHSVSAA